MNKNSISNKILLILFFLKIVLIKCILKEKEMK